MGGTCSDPAPSRRRAPREEIDAAFSRLDPVEAPRAPRGARRPASTTGPLGVERVGLRAGSRDASPRTTCSAAVSHGDSFARLSASHTTRTPVAIGSSVPASSPDLARPQHAAQPARRRRGSSGPRGLSIIEDAARPARSFSAPAHPRATSFIRRRSSAARPMARSSIDWIVPRTCSASRPTRIFVVRAPPAP